MCLIYSNAEEVIAWLGEEEDDDQIALDLVESWATFMATPDRFKEMEEATVRSRHVGSNFRHRPHGSRLSSQFSTTVGG
jgi:hypothetical protein